MSTRIARALCWLLGSYACLGLPDALRADEPPAQDGGPAGDEHAAREGSEATTAAEPSPEQVELARQRFARGVELAARGEYDQAARRFEEALAIRDAPPVRFNLASALFEGGRYVEAYNQLLHVLEAPDLQAEVRARAEHLEDALRDHVGTLTVMVGGEERVRVVVDEQALPPDRLGKPFAVPPGRHVVEAYRGDEVVSRRELEVRPRTRALVDMQWVATPQQAAEQAPPVEAAPVVEPQERSPAAQPKRFGVKDWRLWTIVGGVAVAAAGVALGVSLASGDAGSEPIEGDFEPAVLRFP